MSFVGGHQVHNDIECILGHRTGSKAMARSHPHDARWNPSRNRVFAEHLANSQGKTELWFDIPGQDLRSVLRSKALFLFAPGMLRIQEIETVIANQVVRFAVDG